MKKTCILLLTLITLVLCANNTSIEAKAAEPTEKNIEILENGYYYETIIVDAETEENNSLREHLFLHSRTILAYLLFFCKHKHLPIKSKKKETIMNFSKTLISLRKEKQLTQEQLASHLNISRSTRP